MTPEGVEMWDSTSHRHQKRLHPLAEAGRQANFEGGGGFLDRAMVFLKFSYSWVSIGPWGFAAHSSLAVRARGALKIFRTVAITLVNSNSLLCAGFSDSRGSDITVPFGTHGDTQ